MMSKKLPLISKIFWKEELKKKRKRFIEYFHCLTKPYKCVKTENDVQEQRNNIVGEIILKFQNEKQKPNGFEIQTELNECVCSFAHISMKWKQRRFVFVIQAHGITNYPCYFFFRWQQQRRRQHGNSKQFTTNEFVYFVIFFIYVWLLKTSFEKFLCWLFCYHCYWICAHMETLEEIYRQSFEWLFENTLRMGML